MPLRSSARSNEEEALLSLSRWERLLAFVGCMVAAAICFLIAIFIWLPMLMFKPRKFVFAFTLGSILFMLGYAIHNHTSPVNVHVLQFHDPHRA